MGSGDCCTCYFERYFASSVVIMVTTDGTNDMQCGFGSSKLHWLFHRRLMNCLAHYSRAYFNPLAINCKCSLVAIFNCVAATRFCLRKACNCLLTTGDGNVGAPSTIIVMYRSVHHITDVVCYCSDFSPGIRPFYSGFRSWVC
jgi:hypothetical protein